MSIAAARIRRITVALAAAALVAGCVVQPPPLPTTQDPAQEPASPDPSASATPVADGPYAYQTAQTGADAWSFEPTSVRVVAEDANGLTANEGQQLVIVTIDAEMLYGDPDFYRQFRVAAFDDETNDYWGLSSGTYFYAEDDLFTVGRTPSFQSAQAIFELPVDWPITTWYFLHHSTGEQWFIDLQPS